MPQVVDDDEAALAFLQAAQLAPGLRTRLENGEARAIIDEQIEVRQLATCVHDGIQVAFLDVAAANAA